MRPGIALAVILMTAFNQQSLRAQVRTDGSLGPTTDLSGPNVIVPAELGTRRGGNLFHSFEQFDIPTQNAVTFTGPNDLSNVISRVTGGQPSTIDGTLRSAIPNANVWFMNPAGLLFGPNAQIDVPAGFNVSTADVMGLADGGTFFADLLTQSSLTVAEPAQFGFLSADPAAISLRGSQLIGADGGGLSLTAGAVAMDGANVGGPGNNSFIAAVGGPAVVEFATGLVNTDVRGPITLSNRSLIGGDGDFRITMVGGDVSISDSRVLAGNSRIGDAIGGLGVDAQNLVLDRGGLLTGNRADQLGGDLRIAAESIVAWPGSEIINIAFGTGDAGVMAITADRIEARGTTIQSGSAVDATGNAGAFFVEANSIVLENDANLGSITLGAGDAGEVNIVARDIFVGEASLITSGTTSSGNGGIVRIATDRIVIDRVDPNGDNSAVAVNNTADGGGDAGSILIEAGHVELRNLAEISSSTRSAGNAGVVVIDADTLETVGGGLIASITTSSGTSGGMLLTVDEITLRGRGIVGQPTGLSAQSAAGATGNSGEIVIEARRLALLDRAEIDSSTFGAGDAGSVQITADEITVTEGLISSITVGSGAAGNVLIEAGRLVIDGKSNEDVSQITTQGAPGSAGATGSVAIRADELVLRNAAALDSSAFGTASAGGVFVVAEKMTLSDGGIFSITTGPGDAGLIDINTGSLSIFGSDTGDPALISTRAADGSTGRSGSVLVNAREIDMSGRAAIESSTASDKIALGVAIQTDRLTMRDRAVIASSGFSTGAAGDLIISAGDIALDSAQITTEGTGAEGGRIDIESTGNIILDDSAIISSGIIPADSASLISVTAQQIVMDRSRVLSLAGDDPSPALPSIVTFGEARLAAELTIISTDSVVAASTNVEVLGVDNQLGNELTLPTSSLVQVDQLMTGGCARRTSDNRSSFAQSSSRHLAADPTAGLGAAIISREGAALTPCPDIR